jgi:hypothetical protein
VKAHLGGTDKEADYMMLPANFEALRLDVVDHMIAHCIEHNLSRETNNSNATKYGEIKKPAEVNNITPDKDELMFGGMGRMKILWKSARETDQEARRPRIEMDLDLYLQAPGIQMRRQNREFTERLVWWEHTEERK